jgi:hypothetical protein
MPPPTPCNNKDDADAQHDDAHRHDQLGVGGCGRNENRLGLKLDILKPILVYTFLSVDQLFDPHRMPRPNRSADVRMVMVVAPVLRPRLA